MSNVIAILNYVLHAVYDIAIIVYFRIIINGAITYIEAL